MNRVAVNQDTAEAERAHYVYVQHAKMTSRRGKTVMCEEITDYRFTPRPTKRMSSCSRSTAAS